MNRFRSIAMVFALAMMFAACSGNRSTEGSGGGGSAEDLIAVLPDTSPSDPQNPNPDTPDSPPTTNDREYTTDVLLFNGIGISTSDWQTTEQIIKSEGLSYRLVNSSQLNAMSLDQMTKFGLMVFPGGYGNQITNGLSSETRIRVRQAVRERGVSFLGICAGAWVTVGPDPGAKSASYGFAIVTGSILKLFLPGGRQPTADMVDVSFADGSKRNLVWWGGPYTPEWTGGVVARYDTGQPAISQTWAGKGFVIVSGPHPEAPQSWRNTAGYDSDGLDYAVAADLIQAALKRQPLPTF
ncbi:MAG: BPL-N domain-containing protein [Bdellovibrionota bacterium]